MLNVQSCCFSLFLYECKLNVSLGFSLDEPNKQFQDVTMGFREIKINKITSIFHFFWHFIDQTINKLFKK